VDADVGEPYRDVRRRRPLDGTVSQHGRHRNVEAGDRPARRLQRQLVIGRVAGRQPGVSLRPGNVVPAPLVAVDCRTVVMLRVIVIDVRVYVRSRERSRGNDGRNDHREDTRSEHDVESMARQRGTSTRAEHRVGGAMPCRSVQLADRQPQARGRRAARL
jgi:hypothetical protein